MLKTDDLIRSPGSRVYGLWGVLFRSPPDGLGCPGTLKGSVIRSRLSLKSLRAELSNVSPACWFARYETRVCLVSKYNTASKAPVTSGIHFKYGLDRDLDPVMDRRREAWNLITTGRGEQIDQSGYSAG
ncbi:hypothetical protein MJO29_005754 [Puccinia striiformis f. sp. tritici]|nr:hypothetical protein MJO29_005754 [Puccinia striiformis f. sp. tritici]